MSNSVYANGREISCKSANGKSICAFPDVCLSPPTPPAGPVPIPYPNTAFASDCTSGSKEVKISGKEIMLKDKSYFSKSTGDEAATKTLGMGVVSHQIQGKAYFTSWSMDVKVEGENVCRSLDLTTHNHASPPNTAPWTYLDRMALAQGLKACKAERKRAKDACGDLSKKAKCPSNAGIKKAVKARESAKKAAGKKYKSNAKYQKANANVKKEYQKFANAISKDKCHRALRCFLAPYKPSRCCPGQTGHHLVEASSFFKSGRGGAGSSPMAGCSKYDTDAAPCICAEGPDNTTATHGLMHTFQGNATNKSTQKSGKTTITYGESKKQGASATQKVFKESKCSAACLKAQMDRFHKSKGIKDSTPLRASPSGRCSDADVQNAKKALKVPAGSRR